MKDKILEIINSRGPSVPSDLTKQLGLNTMFVGAYLSELVASKKLFVTKLRVGSSPVYYMDGQQEKLQDYYKNLNGKDKEAFDILKKEGVIRDREQIPIIRVALRNIPDFSTPLNIKTTAGDKEIFWKWYLLTDKEAEEKIKEKLGGENRTEEQKQKETKENKITKTQEQEPKKITVKKEETKEKENKPQEEIKKDDKDMIIEELKRQIENEKETIKNEKQKIEEEKQKLETEKKTREQKPTEQQKTLKKETAKEIEDQFMAKIKEYCKQKNVEIIESAIVKKKTEIDLILSVPSVVGKVRYYCKAKDKKKISEGDLSSAVIKGQTKKLPVLFLSTGELTTKAKKELDNELKNQIIFQPI
jgi:hypothetical protein